MDHQTPKVPLYFPRKTGVYLALCKNEGQSSLLHLLWLLLNSHALKVQYQFPNGLKHWEFSWLQQYHRFGWRSTPVDLCWLPLRVPPQTPPAHLQTSSCACSSSSLRSPPMLVVLQRSALHQCHGPDPVNPTLDMELITVGCNMWSSTIYYKFVGSNLTFLTLSCGLFIYLS